MAKQASKSKGIKSAGAPSKVSAEKFEVGQRVMVKNASTNHEEVAAIVLTAGQSGWYILESEQMKTKISARAGSMKANKEEAKAPVEEAPSANDPDNIDGEDFFQTNRGDPLPYEPDPEDSPESSGPEEAIEDKGLTAAQRMAKALREARSHYIKCKRPDGAATAHNGDDIAKALRDYEPLEVAAIADKALEAPAGTHEAKYGHLNNGQIRMNSGNRIRSAYMKALKEEDKETINRICRLLDLGDDEEESDSE